MKRSMRILAATAYTTFLLWAVGCQTPTTIDYDAAVLGKMQSYASFQVLPRDERLKYQSVALSPIVDRRIEKALRFILSQRGFSEAKTGPDFIVTFNTITKTKTKVHDYGVGLSPFRRYPYYGYSGFSRIDVDQYEEGTFIIDLIDAKSNQLVWRGAHQKRLGWSAPNDGEIQQIISRILAEFPPGLSPKPE